MKQGPAYSNNDNLKFGAHSHLCLSKRSHTELKFLLWLYMLYININNNNNDNNSKSNKNNNNNNP